MMRTGRMARITEGVPWDTPYYEDIAEIINEDFRLIINNMDGDGTEWPAREESSEPIDESWFTGIGTRKLIAYSNRTETQEESDERFEIIYREVRDQLRREREELEARKGEDE